jgi:general secretion pathway protein D
VKNAYLAVVTATCMVALSVARGQSSETPVSEATQAATQAGTPIEQLVAIAAKKTGKKFVLDPRVHANVVLIGGSAADLTYAEFLGVLEVYGYAAVEDGRYVRIIPNAGIRAQAIPTITAKDTRPGPEYVSEIVTVKNVSAAQLIPILRPLINQNGHMAAFPGANAVILVDRFENVRRLEGLIRTLDAAEMVKPRAATDNAEPQH